MRAAIRAIFFPPDENRVREVYDQYEGLVRGVIFNLAGREALDDLTQDVFLRVWSGLSGFGFRSSLKTWVYRIAVNVAIDHLRRRRPKLVDEDVSEIAAEPPATPEESRALVQQALASLDDAHRSVVVLHYFEELPLDEIAAVLELPAGTVKSRLHTARQKLKTILLKKGVET